MDTATLICPICLGLVRTDTAEEDALEFADFPGVVFHAACVEQKGVAATRAVLAANYPQPDEDADDDDDATEEPAAEPTDTDTDNDAE